MRSRDASGEWGRALREAPFGKRTQAALYLHRDALRDAPEVLRRAVIEAERRAGLSGRPGSWDVVKFGPDAVSLLSYPDFWRSPFPALRRGWRVPREGGPTSERSWVEGPSSPILHRKELLVAPGDPRMRAARELTEKLEQKGLFRDAHRIGTSGAWQTRLSRAGVDWRGGAAPLVGLSRLRSNPMASRSPLLGALGRFLRGA